MILTIFQYYFRLKKASTSSPVGPSDENVYNPSRDLFSKTSATTPTTAPTPATTTAPPVAAANKDNNPDGIKDVYSPTQDVEDFYRPPPPQSTSGLRPPGGPPPSGLGGSGYNPRNDLINNQQPGVWDANYDNSNQRSNYYQQDGQQNLNQNIQNSNNSAPAPVRGDPRANRRDPRRRD